MKTNKGNILIPISIVVAAVIIGAAVFFTRGTGGDSNTNTNISNPKVAALTASATQLEVDQEEFVECINNNTFEEKIQSQYQNAIDTGGKGTPWSIVIGPNGQKVAVNGAQPLNVWQDIINKLLAGEDVNRETPDSVENIIPVTGDDHIRGSVDAPII